jgi:hypothetical protein
MVLVLVLPFLFNCTSQKEPKCPFPIEEQIFCQSDSAMKSVCGIIQNQRYLVTYTFDTKIINIKVIVIIKKNTNGIWFASFGSLFSLMIISLILPPDTTLQ